MLGSSFSHLRRRRSWAKLRRLVTEHARGALHGRVGHRLARGSNVRGPGKLILSPGSRIREGAQVYIGPGATLTLGRGAKIGIRAHVNVLSSMTIGDDCDMSWDVEMLDTDFHVILRPDGSPRTMTAPIQIGQHVLIGARAIILKGVTVADGSVIAAGAVVTKDVPAGAVVAGNPAVVVGWTSGWE
jgi:acetyltransferase-like isoleucine patch superfamily enzyme